MGTIYENIKTLCKQNHTSVAEMERKLGFSRGSISKIDQHKPSADKMQKIAAYFETDISNLYISYDSSKSESGEKSKRTYDILTGRNEDDASRVAVSYFIDPETAMIAQGLRDDQKVLMKAARDLTPDQVKILTDLVEQLKGE